MEIKWSKDPSTTMLQTFRLILSGVSILKEKPQTTTFCDGSSTENNCSLSHTNMLTLSKQNQIKSSSNSFHPAFRTGQLVLRQQISYFSASVMFSSYILPTALTLTSASNAIFFLIIVLLQITHWLYIFGIFLKFLAIFYISNKNDFLQKFYPDFFCFLTLSGGSSLNVSAIYFTF